MAGEAGQVAGLRAIRDFVDKANGTGLQEHGAANLKQQSLALLDRN